MLPYRVEARADDTFVSCSLLDLRRRTKSQKLSVALESCLLSLVLTSSLVHIKPQFNDLLRLIAEEDKQLQETLMVYLPGNPLHPSFCRCSFLGISARPPITHLLLATFFWHCSSLAVTICRFCAGLFGSLISQRQKRRSALSSENHRSCWQTSETNGDTKPGALMTG